MPYNGSVMETQNVKTNKICVQLLPLLYTCMCFSSVGTLTKSIIK